MAHTKAGSTVKNLRDSPGQRLGIKKNAGQKVISGNIIVRQRGTKYRAGKGVKVGNDHTLYASVSGVVNFRKKLVKKFTGHLEPAVYVSVV